MLASSALHDHFRQIASGEISPRDGGEMIRACDWMLVEADRSGNLFYYALLANRAAEAADALQMPELTSYYRGLALEATDSF